MSAKAKFIMLENKIDKIASNYFSLNQKIRLNNNLDKSEINIYKEEINKISKAFSKLDGLERMIINNDFFHQNYTYWWKSLFSKSSYYRYKKKAMSNFLGELGK